MKTKYELAYEYFLMAQQTNQLIPVGRYGDPLIGSFTRAAFSYLFTFNAQMEWPIEEAIGRLKTAALDAVATNQTWVKTTPRLKLSEPFYECRINGEGFSLVETPGDRYVLICDGELKVIEKSQRQYHLENLCPCLSH